jgi:signal transduction histidine kinase
MYPPKQRDYLVKVRSAAGALLGIINDILDFSKIEAGKLDIENAEFRFEDVLGNLSTVVGQKPMRRILSSSSPPSPIFRRTSLAILCASDRSLSTSSIMRSNSQVAER